MDDLLKACEIAVKERSNYYSYCSSGIHICRIGETEDLFIFSFKTDVFVCGGGGLIVYKKDFTVADYCIPSSPENILEIIESAVDVEVPEKYR